MFGQTFQPTDLAGVGALIVLEGLLSADNALVLALMVRHLPKNERKKALFFGLIGSFAFRLLAILGAALVLKLWWLQGVGALYLLYLPVRHFLHAHEHRGKPKPKPTGGGLWATIIAVELTDVSFAVDSVLAGVTFIDNNHKKLWVVYVGAILGIVLLRFAAAKVGKMIEKYPMMDHIAYLLVAWVGLKLVILSAHAFDATNPDKLAFRVPEMPQALFWGVLLAILVGGAVLAVAKGVRNTKQLDHEKEAEAQGSE